MFTAVQTLARAKLAVLKGGSAEYAGLLETAHGRTFEDNVGSSDMLKRFSHFTANQSSSASGSSSGTGLGCLPSDSSEPSTLQAKLNVLNCLVFDTPHSFWVGNGANELKRRIDTAYDWLGYGDWVCTTAVAPEGPVPSCKKHDVAFESLQKFAGTAGSDAWGNELDATWNPRNKMLADAKYYADIATHGCQQSSGVGIAAFCALGNGFLADYYFLGVAMLNNKGWPVTKQDYNHAGLVPEQRDVNSSHYSFVSCSTPVPTLSDMRVTQKPNGVFRADWNYKSGCVDDIAISDIKICWGVSVSDVVLNRCASGLNASSNFFEFTFDLGVYRLLSQMADASSAVAVAIITPRDRIYGGGNYSHNWSITPRVER